MTDKLRQAAQQMLEAATDLTILTPREWQAVHGLKINALRAALAEQPAELDRHQAFIDTLPDHLDDKMFEQIDLWARQTYKHHQSQVRGQMFDSGDSHQTHLIYAAFRWAKEHGNPLRDAPEAPQPAKSAEQCWKCGDLDPAGHAKCSVPACGMREAPQPAIPQSWTPTAENINALPESLRLYIADLETNADPAGTVRDLTIARDTIRALEASNRMLRDAAPEAPKPARREPLTWDELDVLWEKQRSKPFKSHGDDLMEFARAIERAHGIGEHE